MASVNGAAELPARVENIGLIGLGVMGSAIARLLVRSGSAVWGYDIADARMEQLRAAGGEPAQSPAELAAACPVVLTSLPSAAALDEVVSGRDGLAGPARLVVELSTLSLPDKERVRHALESAGGRLVDAPLSGTGAQAATGDLVAFVSADYKADLAAAVAVLARFTRAQYDVGSFGNGSRFKFVANLLVAIHNVAAAEAIVLAEKAGLDVSLVLSAVADGAGGSRMLDVRGPLIAAGTYDDATIKLRTFLKDLKLIAEFAEAAGAAVPLLTASRNVYDLAMADGREDQDTACVGAILRQAAAADHR